MRQSNDVDDAVNGRREESTKWRYFLYYTIRTG